MTFGKTFILKETKHKIVPVFFWGGGVGWPGFYEKKELSHGPGLKLSDFTYCDLLQLELT